MYNKVSFYLQIKNICYNKMKKPFSQKGGGQCKNGRLIKNNV